MKTVYEKKMESAYDYFDMNEGREKLLRMKIREEKRIANLKNPVCKYIVYWTGKNGFESETKSEEFWSKSEAVSKAKKINTPRGSLLGDPIKLNVSATVHRIAVELPDGSDIHNFELWNEDMERIVTL